MIKGVIFYVDEKKYEGATANILPVRHGKGKMFKKENSDWKLWIKGTFIYDEIQLDEFDWDNLETLKI